LLKTCTLFTQEKSWRLYLCGGVIAMIFVCLYRSADFLMCLRPVLDSFLLMSFAPPQMVTKSLRCRWLISRRAKRVICSRLEPGITAPITSKVVSSKDESSAAQPLAWLSPMIKILFLYGFQMHLFPIFTTAVFSNKPGKWEASDSALWLSGSVKRLIVGIGCRCCASGCLLYFRLV
jgi:hypothetical protein